jgi:hypothetical protein
MRFYLSNRTISVKKQPYIEFIGKNKKATIAEEQMIALMVETVGIEPTS